jgi:hypothetical protein
MSDRLDAQWAAEQLARHERSYKAGDKGSILKAVALCIAFGLDGHREWPEWLRRAWNDALEAGWTGTISSWDAVFGGPIPKGKHRKSQRLRSHLTLPVVYLVTKPHSKNAAIDKNLFEIVGRKLGISGTTASDLYYSASGRLLSDILGKKPRGKTSAKS